MKGSRGLPRGAGLGAPRTGGAGLPEYPVGAEEAAWVAPPGITFLKELGKCCPAGSQAALINSTYCLT